MLVLLTLVNTCLSNITFYEVHLLPILLQTLVAINSESCQTLFRSFCMQPSEVAMLFISNLSSRPFLRQVINLDLVLCTGFHLEQVLLFLCHIWTQIQMNDRKIEQSNGHCFGQQQLLANSIENFISHKTKRDSSRPKIYEALKPF